LRRRKSVDTQSDKWWAAPAAEAPKQWWSDPPAEKSADAPPKGALRRFAEGVYDGLNPLNIARGIAQTVRHPVDTLKTPSVESWRKVGPALKEGRYTDAANAVAGGIPLIGPAADALSAQWKSGDAAGASGGIAALIAGPKVYKTAWHGAKAAAVNLSGKVLDAAPLVREAALQNRAMPGVIRSGATRTNARLAATEGPLGELVASHAQTPVSMRNLAYAPEAWQQIQNRVKAGPGEAAANRVVSNLRSNVQLQPPTAGGAATVARGSYSATRGKTDPGSIMERAIADNAMKEVGRVVPGAAEQAAKVRDLQAVSHGYAKPASGLPPGMVPTMSARLAIAAANRMIGPAAQGVYNMGRASQMPAEALRALMLQELLTRSGGER
jgi:hypothetical protein